MKKYFALNQDNVVNIVSDKPFVIIDGENKTKNTYRDISMYDKIKDIQKSGLKLGFICNHNQKCGISTYSKFLLDNIKGKVSDYRIFSEINPVQEHDDNITYCWKRGERLNGLIMEIKSWEPDFLIIQHEWGIFSNATYFMLFINELEKLKIPYLVTMHSVYEHLDKSIPVSILENIVVHSNTGKDILKKVGFSNNVVVIPHGCPMPSTKGELWNIFQNPYVLFGYGFGFKYKGVEIAIEAISILKKDPKFENIFYMYCCSNSVNNDGIHNAYYDSLIKKVEELGVQDNVMIKKGYLSEEILENYLRTVKMVLFPYVMEPENTVYGSSGAIKIAMSHNVPVIGSVSHLFDDLDGVIPRINGAVELAQEIDNIFSSHEYWEELLQRNRDYITKYNWDNIGDSYLQAIADIMENY